MHLTVWATLAMLAVYFSTGANAQYPFKSYRYSNSTWNKWEPTPVKSLAPNKMVSQLAMLLVPLWLSALASANLSAAYGLLWCACRIRYRLGDRETPAPRDAGFVLRMVLCVLLVAGTMCALLPA